MNALASLDQSRTVIGSLLDPAARSKLGQFMTPSPVACFMARLFGDLPDNIRLLDAGAGLGSLTAAFVHEACSRSPRSRSLKVTAFEIDPALAERLEGTMQACADECQRAGIAFAFRIVRDDYILYSTDPLMLAQDRVGPFDCAILNPPYAKINTASAWRRALRNFSIETTNLYAAFVAMALEQLAPGGQMVAITPRSFCNGTYFAPFRKRLLEAAAFEHIHLYESRRKAFAEDDVLQENIVFRLTKGVRQPETIYISSSEGPTVEKVSQRLVPREEVVSSSDRQRFIRLPITVECSELAARVRALPATLQDIGITVSTGRVVDFRAREHLRMAPEPGAVPLIYPMHFNGGFVQWPKPDSRKANALALNDATLALVVPRGTYILTKRFTSKEERRRIVAAIYDPGRIDAERVGFENHLNYFHEKGQGLPSTLARGIGAFLNSTAADEFFRQFSGHTQVNATDLRNMHYPTRRQLEALGEAIGDSMPDQHAIDELMSSLL